MLRLVAEKSDISKTNQIKMLESTGDVAEKLFQYLYKLGKGIDYFSIKGWYPHEEGIDRDKKATEAYYRKRHKDIKLEIQKRLSEYGEQADLSTIQYFLSYSSGENYVFFLSPNNKHSGWQQLFCEKWSTNRERIFNLIFKFYLLSQGLPTDTLNGLRS